MAKNNYNSGVTREQCFLHKGFATMQLKNAFLSLRAIGKTCAQCDNNKWVVQALIRDAVVQYGSIFKYSNVGEDQRHKLDVSIVPEKYKELHSQLVSYRDQLFAHFDFAMMNPVKEESDQGVSWHVDNKGPNDFIDKLVDIRALIVCIMKKLGSDIVKEHQEFS